MSDSDPNEAYEIVPTPEALRCPPGWWTVTRNGSPVMHYGPDKKHLAEQFATDPEYRRAQITPKLWEKNAER